MDSDAVDTATALFDWAAVLLRRADKQPDAEVSERSRRMMDTRLWKARELLGKEHAQHEIVDELRDLQIPWTVADAAEQVRILAMEICLSYDLTQLIKQNRVRPLVSGRSDSVTSRIDRLGEP